MKTKNVTYGLLLALLALALHGCACSKKTRCSCPSFRGSRAIYGNAEVEKLTPQEREAQWR